jgi:hypothetical protein
MRIGPARDVARREDSGCARFEEGVHDHSAVEPEAGFFRKVGPRAHANADNHEIGVEGGPAFQPDVIAVYDDSCVLEVEDHAVLLMQGADEVTDLRT